MSDVVELDRPVDAAAAMTIDRDAMLAAVRAVGAAVERRNTIPILSNLMLKAEDGQLTIIASDLDLWSHMVVPCEGGVLHSTVEAARLLTSIDTLRPGAIEFAPENGALVLKQGRSRRKLPTLPPHDFPVPKPMNDAVRFAMEASALLRILEAARVSASTEETRYYLNGVFMHVTGDHLAAASVDGHRMTQVKFAIPSGAENLPDIIIPNKAVNLICRMLGDAPEGAQVAIEVSETAWMVRLNRSLLRGKLVDGTFPDYQRIIPQPRANSLNIHAAEFERCVRAAAAATDGKSRGIRIDLDPSQCLASGYAVDGGTAEEPMDGSYAGQSQAVGVNSSYALSFAKIFGTAAMLDIEFGDPRDLITVTSNDRPGVLAALMPMNA